MAQKLHNLRIIGVTFQKESNMKMRILATAVIALFVSVSAASAAVVYQSIPNMFTTNGNGGQWCSTCSGTYITYGQFSLSQATNIDGVTFGAYNSSFWTNNPYTILIANNNAGTIGTQIFSQTIASLTAGGTTPNNQTVFLSGTLSGLNLNAGNYWIGFQGLPNGATSSFNAPGHTWIQHQQFSNNFFQTTNQDLAFILTGSSGVPAPGALMLLGLGLLGIAGLRRRKAA